MKEISLIRFQQSEEKAKKIKIQRYVYIYHTIRLIFDLK